MKTDFPAISQALLYYQSIGATKPFEVELGEYLRFGHVIATPKTFAMGKQVELEGKGKAWFVCMAVGNLGELVRQIPYYLPWVCFFRRGRGDLHIWKTDRLMRHQDGLIGQDLYSWHAHAYEAKT